MTRNHWPRNSGRSARNLVSVPRAAEMIGISTKTLRRWIDADKVPAYRVGEHSIRVDRDEVLALVRPLRETSGGVA
ncbi:helix-turn-helix domain-containing protein [Nocardia brasiliensis]|uniref:helix-turn-helix domain-containing protein n=1 Tax=Nocardia brasiliensis TaxID=37326 RepID=UPI003CC7DB3C